MAKIMLLATSGINGVPYDVSSWLTQYASQGHEFITGDGKTTDGHFHKELAKLGLTDKSTIYCMDKPKSNVYELKVRSFGTSYNESDKQVGIFDNNTQEQMLIIDGVDKEMDIPYNREWYEFRDRQMVRDCDMAIILLGTDSKAVNTVIRMMNILGKPCYTFQL